MLKLSTSPGLRSRETSGTHTRAFLPAAVVLAATLTFVATMLPDAARAASDAPRTGWFTPACAAQDLRAVAIIEQRAEVVTTPPERLTEAGFAFLQARILCLSGRENEGVALYRSAIDSIGGVEAPHATAGNAMGRVPQ